MKRRIPLFLLLVVAFCTRAVAQQVALKTNALTWATTTPNLGVEVALGRRVTLDLEAAYNPWTFKNDRKMHCWLAQPEVKYWFCEKFEGHFLGLHAHAGQFFGGFHRRRYDGYLAGGGVAYGHHWILSPHWNVEARVGVGYARLWYKESPRIACLKCQQQRHRNYVGPTELGLSFVYIF